MEKKVLHVVSVPFSISYFLGEQFKYFNKSKQNYKFFVACSPSENLQDLSVKYDFESFGLQINRAITPFEDVRAIFKLRKFILENNINVVIGHTPKGGMIAMIAALLAGVKNKIYFRHGLVYETSKGLKKQLLKKIEKLSGGIANKVVCVSNGIKEKSISDKLNKKSKNIILGMGTCSGVDCDNRFNPNKINYLEVKVLKSKLNIYDSDIVFGFIGRIVRDKGINELIEAWYDFSKKYNNVKLMLVGPIEERDQISDKSIEIILNDDSIIHVGEVEDVAIYYATMNVFILPSYREGFPTVILEASSMELPIITTNATGCKEAIIEGETGIITSINAEAIYQSFEFFIQNSDKQREFGKKGRNFIVENFEQTKVWDIIEKQIL
ncbi:Glycosyltransferase involved in cell wall bisynthesis [Chryseobacterium carnipullorum]|uniref:glycosyltransferase family 4 protein n=1 Tax=Chryseobacterium carnipullorum TaxID=1124835 RepID=UPI00091F4F3A|nr:glycosyltransferase family 4 protein [Chryseobacterium carnipullorum]SHN01770.1 Glycosyltransferase involved in cell wall bisynthesis [Chryseobacterium carnipullorum]